jgi:hypothetical protein
LFVHIKTTDSHLNVMQHKWNYFMNYILEVTMVFITVSGNFVLLIVKKF